MSRCPLMTKRTLRLKSLTGKYSDISAALCISSYGATLLLCCPRSPRCRPVQSPVQHLEPPFIDHLVGGAASLWSCYARQQEGFQRLNSHLLLCLKSGTPTCMKRTSSSLSESCPKIGDLPKSPFPPVAALVPSAGTITLQIS